MVIITAVQKMLVIYKQEEIETYHMVQRSRFSQPKHLLYQHVDKLCNQMFNFQYHEH